MADVEVLRKSPPEFSNVWGPTVRMAIAVLCGRNSPIFWGDQGATELLEA